MQDMKVCISYGASQHTRTHTSDVSNRTFNQWERTSLNDKRWAVIHRGPDIPCNKSKATDPLCQSTNHIITGSFHGQGTSMNILTPELLVRVFTRHKSTLVTRLPTSQSAMDCKLKLTEGYPRVSQYVYLDTGPTFIKAGHYTLKPEW
jgi:hypothetical protein